MHRRGKRKSTTASWSCPSEKNKAISPKALRYERGYLRLYARTRARASSAEYGLIQIYVPIPDFEIEAAIRTGAYPRFVVNRRPLTAEIGQRHQDTCVTLQTFGKGIVFHDSTSSEDAQSIHQPQAG